MDCLGRFVAFPRLAGIPPGELCGSPPLAVVRTLDNQPPTCPLAKRVKNSVGDVAPKPYR